MKITLDKLLEGMHQTRDCFGLQEHKVLTLNTVFNYPIEEPKTREMEKLKNFGESCFKEGWIHAVSQVQEFLKSTVKTGVKDV